MGPETNQVSEGIRPEEDADKARTGMSHELDQVLPLWAAVPTHGGNHQLHALNWFIRHSLWRYREKKTLEIGLC